MKNLLLFLLITTSFPCFSQDKASDQKNRMDQYIGIWYLADNINDNQLSQNPKIKMIVEPKFDGNFLQVEVFDKHDDKWKSILVELISYDVVNEKIVASGQNQSAQCFVGTGFFDTKLYIC